MSDLDLKNVHWQDWAFWDWAYYGNTVEQWAIAVGLVILAFFVLRWLRDFFVSKLDKFVQKTTNDFDDFLVDLIRRIHPIVFISVSIYIASLELSLSGVVKHGVEIVPFLAIMFQSFNWSTSLISYALAVYKRKQESRGKYVSPNLANGFNLVGRLILWSVILLVSLDTVGVDITALVAGLGVGGIAIGLAAQNILSDLFAYLSIILDEPFIIGDFIIVGDYMGNVEHIGLKTTRVRSLGGEQLIFGNADLLGSRIRNYKRMEQRRIVFALGVTYDTSHEKLEKIPSMIKTIVESVERTRFDRSHFKDYGDFSLNYETVYYVLSADYNDYMDIQQEINFAIYKKFNEEGIEFAFPTQTIYTAKAEA